MVGAGKGAGSAGLAEGGVGIRLCGVFGHCPGWLRAGDPGAGGALAGFEVAAPAGGGFGFLAEGEEGAGFEEGFGVGEGGREVARAEGFECGGGLAGVEEDLGEGRRRRAVARILLQYGFAQRACARGLAVAEEHPRGEEEELAVVLFQG